MNHFPEIVKSKLNSIIYEMGTNYWLYVNNPGHDFTRQHTGKLTFEDTLKLPLCIGKGTIAEELEEFFNLDASLIPTDSAFVQRSKQISLSAYEYLFSEFSTSFPNVTKRFKGMSILAADGTHVVYTTNAEIIEDYNKPRMEDYKGFNHMHLNGFIDVLSKVFIDAVIQPGQHPDERAALHSMLDHFFPDDPENYIITVDRGYESYDMIFHCMLRNFKYVFRVKSPNSDTSILSSYIDELPEDQEEYDVPIARFFTDKYNNIIKQQGNVYHYMSPYKNAPHFYPLLGKNHAVYVPFRVLKIKAGDDSYEYIITNLPFSFDLDDIRTVYHYRWQAEVSFRYLKHAASMLYFHSKLPDLLRQEIYASLILYNYGIFIANEAASENSRKPRKCTNKYKYEIDIAKALNRTKPNI